MADSRSLRPIQQRKNAAEHIAYELGILRAAFVSIRGQSLVSVAMLEVFLTHTRNLIEFFWDGAPKRGILPKHFGAPAARDKDPGMRQLREEISQLLSHLSWERVDVHALKRQDWSFPRMSKTFDSIKGKAGAFLNALPPDERQWFTCAAFPNEYSHWLGDPVRQ